MSYDDALAAVITVRDGISEFAVSGHRLTGPMAVTAEGNIRVTGGLTVRGTHAIVHNLPPCASFDIERVLGRRGRGSCSRAGSSPARASSTACRR